MSDAAPITEQDLAEIEARVARGYDGYHADEETLITEDAPRLVAEVRRLVALVDACELALKRSSALLLERASQAEELLAEVERLRTLAAVCLNWHRLAKERPVPAPGEGGPPA